MEQKTCLAAVSTYLKSGALEDLLDSLIEHGYDKEMDILVCDDGDGHSRNTVSHYPGVLYTTGTNLGIGGNKCRGQRYFLENPQYTELLLLDDDIVFMSPGLLQELRRTGAPHVTGYLGSMEPWGFSQEVRTQFSGNPFFTDFPVKGMTETGLIFCQGSQGFLMYFTREIVEKAKYFHRGPGRYGYEHSIYSNVINRIQGYQMDWFPILYKTPKYVVGNYSWPNQYEAKPQENHKWWMKKRIDIASGVNYINKNSGVPSNETVEMVQ